MIQFMPVQIDAYNRAERFTLNVEKKTFVISNPLSIKKKVHEEESW